MSVIFQPRIKHYVRVYVFCRICEPESDLQPTNYLTMDFSFLHGKGRYKSKKYPVQPNTRNFPA